MVKSKVWVLGQIERLMQPGVKIHARDVNWCVVQRDKFYADGASPQPGSTICERVRRLVMQAGLEQRRPLPRRLAERGVHPSDEPRASSPAALQGSRAPTPMPGWLVTGRGLPLRPPSRRAVTL